MQRVEKEQYFPVNTLLIRHPGFNWGQYRSKVRFHGYNPAESEYPESSAHATFQELVQDSTNLQSIPGQWHDPFHTPARP